MIVVVVAVIVTGRDDSDGTLGIGLLMEWPVAKGEESAEERLPTWCKFAGPQVECYIYNHY